MKKWFVISMFIGFIAMPLMYIIEYINDRKCISNQTSFEKRTSEYGVVVIAGSAIHLLIIIAVIQVILKTHILW